MGLEINVDKTEYYIIIQKRELSDHKNTQLEVSTYIGSREWGILNIRVSF